MPDGVPLFEELIFDADPGEDLHVMLVSPGGDGEAAVRLVRSAQQRCRSLTVLVPDEAKSAATIFCLGAHHIVMGPTSDLGPIDPQVRVGDSGWFAAKDLIQAVHLAEQAIAVNPASYPLHISLLAEVNALVVQQARSALAETDDLVDQAVRSNPERGPQDIARLKDRLGKTLVDDPKVHNAVFGCSEAKNAGLPVIECDPRSEQWRLLWRLWTHYLALGPPRFMQIYEGRHASQVLRAEPMQLIGGAGDPTAGAPAG